MLVRVSLLKKFVVVGLGLLVVSGAGVGYAAMTLQEDPPQVESVDSEWGDVSQQETEVQTTVVVRNPNDIGIPGVAGITYTTSLNGVEVISGSQSSVGISPGRNEIRIPATIQNRAIARWWVTHVNNGEKSTMSIRASLDGPGGVSRPITTRSSTFETNVLETMETNQSTTVTFRGEEFVVLKEQTASWGEATMESTPVHFSATVTNKHDQALALDGLGYEIGMNNVTVGTGQTKGGVEIEPGETGTIDVDAAIDTKAMADWWATHVRNNESTRMTVAMYGLVERDGELRRVPIELFERDLRFETNMLDGGATSVDPIENADGNDHPYEKPTIVDTSQEWGTVTDGSTNIRTTVTVDNPNDGDMNEFVSVAVGQRVSINGVTVANGSSDLGTLARGRNRLNATVAMDNTKVPQWWARHVNNGEQSTLVVDPRASADLGFTKIPVAVDGRRSTMETDMLAGLATDDTQEIRKGGRTVAEIHRTRPTWGKADAQSAPIEIAVTVENTAPGPITLDNLRYTIGMNDVTVGDGTAPEAYTIQPGQTRTVTYTIVIDSQKMDEWWVSHVENGEVTQIDVGASIRASAGGSSERVDLDGLTDSQSLETDLLATRENESG